MLSLVAITGVITNSNLCCKVLFDFPGRGRPRAVNNLLKIFPSKRWKFSRLNNQGGICCALHTLLFSKRRTQSSKVTITWPNWLLPVGGEGIHHKAPKYLPQSCKSRLSRWNTSMFNRKWPLYWHHFKTMLSYRVVPQVSAHLIQTTQPFLASLF